MYISVTRTRESAVLIPLFNIFSNRYTPTVFFSTIVHPLSPVGFFLFLFFSQKMPYTCLSIHISVHSSERVSFRPFSLNWFFLPFPIHKLQPRTGSIWRQIGGGRIKLDQFIFPLPGVFSTICIYALLYFSPDLAAKINVFPKSVRI